MAAVLRVVMVASLAAMACGRVDAEGGVRTSEVAMTERAKATPKPCGATNDAARHAVARRARVAGFYDFYLALVDGAVYEWRLGQAARRAFQGATHVAVAGTRGYAIDADNRLQSWALGGGDVAPLLDDVALASAGDSSVLAIRCDSSLWQRRADGTAWQRIAGQASHAWVGDSSDYYIDGGGRLYASGKAHRGQYGDGRLTEAPGWTPVAERAAFVVAHTGHAVYLRDDGAVLGTGGNRFGPLATHGLGDKADRWGVIFKGASQIGTGSRHSLALRADGSLWTWGGADGTKPKLVRNDVAAAAGGLDGSVALAAEGSVWSWTVGQVPKRVDLPRR